MVNAQWVALNNDDNNVQLCPPAKQTYSMCCKWFSFPSSLCVFPVFHHPCGLPSPLCQSSSSSDAQLDFLSS